MDVGGNFALCTQTIITWHLSNYGCSRVFIHLSNHSYPLNRHLQTLTTCLRACRIGLFEMIVEHCIWTIQGLKGSVRAVPGPGFLLQGDRSGPGWFWGHGLLLGCWKGLMRWDWGVGVAGLDFSFDFMEAHTTLHHPGPWCLCIQSLPDFTVNAFLNYYQFVPWTNLAYVNLFVSLTQ